MTLEEEATIWIMDANIPSLGISNEQLIQNLPPWLHTKIKDTCTVPWPPQLERLEEGKN